MDKSSTVRPATSGDLGFLIATDRHPDSQTMAQLVSAGRVTVLEEQGTLSGWLRWNLFWDEIPFLNMLCVEEQRRGRGLGGCLMDAWEASMRAGGHTFVLTSTQSDEEAQHFYRRRGYKDCGALFLPDQACELFLRKELQDKDVE
ncbi:GNAT family N-acetyltransferase [Tessaracoccus terricola]